MAQTGMQTRVSNGKYHFQIDWDDFVHRDLVSYVKEHPSPNGYQ